MTTLNSLVALVLRGLTAVLNFTVITEEFATVGEVLSEKTAVTVWPLTEQESVDLSESAPEHLKFYFVGGVISVGISIVTCCPSDRGTGGLTDTLISVESATTLEELRTVTFDISMPSSIVTVSRVVT
jgi:hypothetical protein